MKLICMTGYTGSGKTTAAKMLASILPKSDAFDSDYFMYTSTRHFRKEFEGIFNVKLDWDNYADCFRNTANSSTLQQNNEYFDLIMPFVDSKIDEMAIFKKSRGFEYFVVEWAFLPLLETWKKANCRIIVEAPKELRYKMLRERLCAYENFNGDPYEVGELRDGQLKKMMENAKYDYILENSYNEKLNENIYKLVDITG